MITSATTFILATTIFLGAIKAQITCPNSGGQGVYNGLCVTCPSGTWAPGGSPTTCSQCFNNQPCNIYDGSATICGNGIKNCEINGNALSCLANFYLDGSNGCAACDADSGMTTTDGNQLTACNAPSDVNNNLVGCNSWTDACDISVGNSINCYIGSELIGNVCKPCKAGTQQPLDGTTSSCQPCVTGQDVCLANGQALFCSANWVLTSDADSHCRPCPDGQTSIAGRMGVCTTPAPPAPPVPAPLSCAPGQYTLNATCTTCRVASSSMGGVDAKCLACGTNVQSCSISTAGVITPLGCRSITTLINGICVLNKCRVGVATCTPTNDDTCTSKYHMVNKICTLINVYDYINGYQFATSDSLKTLSIQNDKTPSGCLTACETTTGCQALFVGTNDLKKAGACYLYSRVLQRSDLIPTILIPFVGSVKAAKSKNQSKRAIYHGAPIQVMSSYKFNIVLNRESTKGPKSIASLPYGSTTCTSLPGDCFKA